MRRDLEQVRVRKANESEPIDDASLRSFGVAKTTGVYLLWDESVGCLMTGQTATGVEGA